MTGPEVYGVYASTPGAGEIRSERKLGISVDDQHVAAENTPDYEALTLNGDHSGLRPATRKSGQRRFSFLLFDRVQR